MARTCWLHVSSICCALFLVFHVVCSVSNAEGSKAGSSFEKQLAGSVMFEAFPTREMTTDAGTKVVAVKKRGRKEVISAPGALTSSDTEYVLDRDITAAGTAISIEASGVTLNLNGHTITYQDSPSQEAVHGVAIPGYHRKDIVICNGRIIQGDGEVAVKENCAPVFDYDASVLEIGGLEIVYHAPDTSGILLQWVSDATIAYTTIIDKGTVVTNRHQGVAAIEADRGGRASRHFIHHDRIVGARHIGIRAGKESDVYNNDITLSSRVTNSTGISASGAIHHNRIIGEGVHPIGIWPGSNVVVHDNYVEVRNTRTGSEYGDTGASCLRMTWGNDAVEVRHNTFILQAGENWHGSGVKSWGRALWVGLPKPEQRADFSDNLIIATNDDGKSKAAAIAVVCLNESPNLVFRNNTVVSNWANVLLGDSYGHAGGFARFIDNRFIRIDRYANYRTIRSSYPYRPSTGVFISNSYENGASVDSIDLEFSGTGLKEIAFGWHVNILVKDGGVPAENAVITIKDARGETVFEGKADKNGMVKEDLVAYLLTNRGRNVGGQGEAAQQPASIAGKRVEKYPYQVIAEYNGKRRSKEFEMDKDTSLELRF